MPWPQMEVKERESWLLKEMEKERRMLPGSWHHHPLLSPIPTLKPTGWSHGGCTSSQPGLSSAEGRESFANAAQPALPQEKFIILPRGWAGTANSQGLCLGPPACCSPKQHAGSQPVSGQLFCHSPGQAAQWSQHLPRLTVTPQTLFE